MPSGSVFRFILFGGMRAFGSLVLLVLLFGWGSRALFEPTHREQVAFYAQQQSGRNNGIYLMDVARALSQKIYTSDDWVFSMAWSPAGDQIAFSVQEQNTYHLYVMDADGRNPRRVTPQATSSQPLHWSPDGQQIIFESYIATMSALYIADVATGETRILIDSTSGITTDFQWSPDFQQAAFATLRRTNAGLDIYTVRTECVLQVVNCRSDRAPNSSSSDDFAPIWSADGRQIAFISNRQGQQQIYIADAGCKTPSTICNERPRLLAPLAVNDFTLSWSPDNHWLLFSVYTRGAGSKLYLANMQCEDCSRRFHNLTPNPDEDIFAAWSPDSRYFLYVKRHRSDVADIALMDIRCAETGLGCTRSSRLLTRNLYAWYPIWRPAATG